MKPRLKRHLLQEVKRFALIVGAGLALIALAECVKAGELSDAVVKVGGCSGVCVDPSGIVLTAKHCEPKETETVLFPNHPPIEGRRVYVDELAEGVVAFQVDGDGWAFAPVADAVPPAGSAVSSIGYPSRARGRQAKASGKLTGGQISEYSVDGVAKGKFQANNVDFFTGPGWSGGPLFNERGEVIGILSAGDHRSSVFISWGATRRAFDATVNQTVTPDRESLVVFGYPGCPGCENWKRDNAAGLFRRYDTEFVDVTTPAGADRYRTLKAAIEKATGKKQPEGFPAFHIAGRAALTVGYRKQSGGRRLLDWGRETLRLPVTLLDSITGDGGSLGVSPPPPGFEDVGKYEREDQPTPTPDNAEISEDTSEATPEPVETTETTPEPQDAAESDTGDDSEDDGGLPWGAILGGLAVAVAEAMRDRFRVAA